MRGGSGRFRAVMYSPTGAIRQANRVGARRTNGAKQEGFETWRRVHQAGVAASQTSLGLNSPPPAPPPTLWHQKPRQVVLYYTRALGVPALRRHPRAPARDVRHAEVKHIPRYSTRTHIAQNSSPRAGDTADENRDERVETPADTVLRSRDRKRREPDRVYRLREPPVHAGAHVRKVRYSRQNRPEDEGHERGHRAYSYVLDLRGKG